VGCRGFDQIVPVPDVGTEHTDPVLDPTLKDSNGKDDNIDKAQLQILIEVTEGLLSHI
jgi:hypothetical protein